MPFLCTLLGFSRSINLSPLSQKTSGFDTSTPEIQQAKNADVE